MAVCPEEDGDSHLRYNEYTHHNNGGPLVAATPKPVTVVLVGEAVDLDRGTYVTARSTRSCWLEVAVPPVQSHVGRSRSFKSFPSYPPTETLVVLRTSHSAGGMQPVSGLSPNHSDSR